MKKTLAILALGLTAIAGHAATPLWMRDVQISPDGTEIAFCYKGDIYKVPAKGGTATQLTTQESYECTPIWSPSAGITNTSKLPYLSLAKAICLPSGDHMGVHS